MSSRLKSLIESGVPVAHLKIGECIFARRPLVISTVLGSCVSATFFHRDSRASAMFHAMLPDSSMTKVARRPCNYVDTAVAAILERFRRLGLRPAALEVKLLGGANTMQDQGRRVAGLDLDVGRRNVERARAVLAAAGLRIEREHTLGEVGRTVAFSTLDGEVYVRHVDAPESEEYTAIA